MAPRLTVWKERCNRREQGSRKEDSEGSDLSEEAERRIDGQVVVERGVCVTLSVTGKARDSVWEPGNPGRSCIRGPRGGARG